MEGAHIGSLESNPASESQVLRSAVAGVLQRLVRTARIWVQSDFVDDAVAYSDALAAAADLAEELANASAAERLRRSGFSPEQLDLRVRVFDRMLAEPGSPDRAPVLREGQSLLADLSGEFGAAMRMRAYLDSILAATTFIAQSAAADVSGQPASSSAEPRAASATRADESVPLAGKPVLYVGHTVAGRDAAELLNVRLSEQTESSLAEISASQTSIEQLEKDGSKAEYAVFVLASDPGEVHSEGEMRRTCFEAGYFMGRRGRDRTFVVVPSSQAGGLPPPLSTLRVITFNDERTDQNLKHAVGPAATQILEAIERAV